WAQRLAKVRNLRIVSIRGHEILDQVVGADRDEVGLAQQGVDAEGGGGNLDHHARLDILGKEYTFPPKVVARLLHHLVDLAQLFQGRDHRKEHRDLAVSPGTQDGSDLSDEQLGVLEEDADRSPAHERVWLAPATEMGNGLVTPQVERANRHRLAGRIQDDLSVVLVLLFLAGDIVVRQEQVFGPEEADTRGPDSICRVGVRQVVDICQQLGAGSVQAPRRLVPVRDQTVFEMEELTLNFTVGHGRLLVRANQHMAFPPINDHEVAAGDVVHDPFHSGDGRDPAAARQDRRMAGRATNFRDDAGDWQITQA